MTKSTRVVITDGNGKFMECEPVDASEHAVHGWRFATQEEADAWRGAEGTEAEDASGEDSKVDLPGDVAVAIPGAPGTPAEGGEGGEGRPIQGGPEAQPEADKDPAKTTAKTTTTAKK